MIAIDTNILVYAHREDSPHHAVAAAALKKLSSGSARWGLPWPCVHEFLAVVTHQRIYSPPSPMRTALDAVKAITSLPNVELLHELPSHALELERQLSRGDVTGPRVHDARIAAICVSHGVTELWTADRDFSWFPGLRTLNPLTK